MMKLRRLVWLVALVLVPLAALTAFYGASGYAMNGSMSVAMNYPHDQAVTQARLWLALIGTSVVVFAGGLVVLFRWSGSA